MAQQYLGVTASDLVKHDNVALAAFKSAEQHRDDASKALGQAALALTSDESAENRDLLELVKDVATLEHAGACATVTITPPPLEWFGRRRRDNHDDDDGAPDHHDHHSPADHNHDGGRAHHHDDHRADGRSVGRTGRPDDDHHDGPGPADDHQHGAADHHHHHHDDPPGRHAIDGGSTPRRGTRRRCVAGLYRIVCPAQRRLTSPMAAGAPAASQSTGFRARCRNPAGERQWCIPSW